MCGASECVPTEIYRKLRETLTAANPNLDEFTVELAISLSPLHHVASQSTYSKTNESIAIVVEGSLRSILDDSKDFTSGDVLDEGAQYVVTGGNATVVSVGLHPKQAYFVRILGTGSYGYAELFDAGGFGKVAVKRAKHTSHGYHKQLALREVENLRKVASPHVIKLLAVLRDTEGSGVDSIVLEYAGRGNLAQFLAQNEMLSSAERYRYAVSILKGLHAVHESGIAIRDLKTENVLLYDNNTVKLSDFGFSKHLGQHGRTLTICGTPPFMAPEVFSGSGYGLKCDMWAFGYVLRDLFFSMERSETDEAPLADGRMQADSVCSLVRSRTGSMQEDALVLSLIDNLIIEDELNRFDVNRCMYHPLFATINWREEVK